MMDQVGQPGGPLADASVWHLEVTQTGALTPNLYRLLLTTPDWVTSVTTRVKTSSARAPTRRPYRQPSLHHPPVGSREFPPSPSISRCTARARAPNGSAPRRLAVASTPSVRRGKITAQHGADWHLFIVDDTGLPGSLAMMEALPVGAVALALLKIDSPADEQSFEADQLARLDVRWLHRLGHSEPGDPSPLLGALGATRFPAGRGHVYVAAELRVVRALQRSLGERGLAPDQISAKAYWKRGLPNAEHGEPAREE